MKSWSIWNNVEICRVETPAILWLRRCKKETEPMYQEFKKLEHQLCSSFHTDSYKKYNVDVELKKGQYAIVRHNDTWRRATILDVDERLNHPTIVKVFFLDYGDTISVSGDKVTPLTEGMWSSVPYLCRRIQLVNTVPSEIIWRTDDGIQQICFKPGNFWSSSAMRLVKEISKVENCCRFSPTIPFVPTSNELNVGNLNLEMTPAITNILRDFTLEGKEELEPFENLADILVGCKMAVLIAEDLSERMAIADEESRKVNDTVSRHPEPSHRTISPIYNKSTITSDRNDQSSSFVKHMPVRKDVSIPSFSQMEINNKLAIRDPDVVAMSPSCQGKPFRMEISMNSWPHSNSSCETSLSSLTTSGSGDLHDIPLPSDSYYHTSGSNSSIFDTRSNTSPESNNSSLGERLTGYEKKVRFQPQDESPPNPLKTSKGNEDLEGECKSECNLDSIMPRMKGRKSCSANPFIRPLLDEALMLRVYNSGKMPVPRDQLIFDKADSSRWLNEQVLKYLKQANEVKEEDFKVSPLQMFMWPAMLRGQSCVAVERRSQGKTLGAVVPLASQILDQISVLRRYAPSNSGPFAIIVCPDWLCVKNVTTHMENMTNSTSVRVAAVYGGMSPSGSEENKKNMFSVDILITTAPSLPRLGLFLLQNKPSYDQSIPCISLEKCSFLVFDNFDVTHQRFPELTEALLDKWLITIKQNETMKQVTITSKRWSEALEKVTEKIAPLTPNILISSIFEAAVACKIDTRLDCCRSEPLVSQAVCDNMFKYTDKKVIVFLDGPQQSERLEDLLYTKAMSVIKVTSADRPVVKRAIDSWHNCRSCLMLIVDATIIEYMSSDIKNADVIFHASPPSNSYHLGLRYSYMLDKMENSHECVSHFMLTPEMISRKPQIVPELRRLGVQICDQAQAAYEEGIRQQKKQANSKALCFSHKCFGKCLDSSNCTSRHYLTSADTPHMLPSCGQVKLEIIGMVSASCFLGRIRSYKSADGRITNLEKTHQRLHMLMQDYYQSRKNRRPLANPSVGCLCALEKQSWVRAEIIESDYSQLRPMFTVRTLDEQGLEKRSIDALYELKEDAKIIPPLAVEIILSGIKPVDEDSEFTEYAKHVASNALLHQNGNGYFTCVVRYALRNTLFVDEIVEIRTIANIPKETGYLARDLVQRKVAAPNPSHLRSLCLDESNNVMQFKSDSNSWMQNYVGSMKEPLPDSVQAESINCIKTIGVIEPTSDTNSNVSSSSDSILHNTTQPEVTKCTRRIDALKARMRRSLPNQLPSACRSVPEEKLEIANPILLSLASPPRINTGPPPACLTPPIGEQSYSDLIGDDSNFDIVFQDKDEDSASSVNIASSIELQLNEAIDIEIKAIFSPNSFFVNKFSNINFLNMLDDSILELTDSLVPFDPDEIARDCYVAEFTDGFYYRAQLTEIQEGSCTVNFVDHGERMVLSWDKICVCPPKIASEPFQAIHCSLHGIRTPRKLFVEAKNLMNNLVDTHNEWILKPIKVEQLENELLYSVELFTAEGTVDMAKSLVEAGLAKETTSLSEQEKQNSGRLLKAKDLRNERLTRLINDRSLMHSPTDTIKEYLNDEGRTAESVVSSRCDDEASTTSKQSRLACMTSRLKRLGLYNCPSAAKPSAISPANSAAECAASVVSKSCLSRVESGPPNKQHSACPPSQNVDKIHHPHSTWKDGYSIIVLTFHLCAVENYTFDASSNAVYFTTTLNGKEFTFDDRLYAPIIQESSVCYTNGREVIVKLFKKLNGPWPRLLAVEGRIPWLKRDMSDLDDASLCSSTVSNGSSMTWRKPPGSIKKYGGLPAGISDSDSVTDYPDDESEADSELFKFG